MTFGALGFHDYPDLTTPLLAAAGLDLISRFGELCRAPFGAGSRVQVCLCRGRS
jgi:hypothetical protein